MNERSKFQEKYTEKMQPEFYAKYDSFILTLYNLNYLEGQDGTHDGTHSGTQDVPQNVPQGVPQDSHDKQILEMISYG
jgi:hypothetical protein